MAEKGVGLGDRAFAEEWDDLAGRCPATPFHRHGWFAAWWSAFGSGHLEILTSRRSGKLVGVLPLVRRRGVVGLPANWHTFVSGPLAEDDQAAADLFSQLLDRTRFVGLVGHLVTADSARLAGLAQGRRFGTDVDTIQRAPYIAIDRPFAEYARTRDTRWLRQLESRRRKLVRAGELRLEVHDGRENLDGVLAELFRVESLGWKSENGTAIVSQPGTRRFYSALARWAASAGLLRIGLMTLDGRTIAADLALEDGHSHYFLKTGFDPELRKLAPGLILRRDMIERVFGLGLDTYEFLGSADRYKLDWTESLREIDEVRLFPRSAGGLAARAARDGHRAAVRGRALLADARGRLLSRSE